MSGFQQKNHKAGTKVKTHTHTTTTTKSEKIQQASEPDSDMTQK